MKNEHFFEKRCNRIKKQLSKSGINLENGLPIILDYNFINEYNSIIISSVIFKKSIIKKFGMMSNIKNAKEHAYWKNILKEKKCFFIDLPCLHHNLEFDSIKK